MDKNVSNFAFEHSLSGFEFLSCIPGTIGGAIRMNSGCYGEDISKILISVQAMDLNGKMKVIYSRDIKFSYRGCNLDNNLIFVSATFRGKKDNKTVKVDFKLELCAARISSRRLPEKWISVSSDSKDKNTGGKISYKKAQDDGKLKTFFYGGLF